MQGPLLILAATALFAVMGLCVKLASAQYSAGEIVFYRSIVGVLYLAALTLRPGRSLRTAVPLAHLKRNISSVTALCLYFLALGHLPLATAVTLNYMSSVWIALFLAGLALVRQTQKVDARVVAALLVGFLGVTLVLRPTIEADQLAFGLAGLASGMLAALAYLQMIELSRAGEPEYRVVFYFSAAGIVAGGLLMAQGGLHSHTAYGVALLLAIGLLAAFAQMLFTRAFAIGPTLTIAGLQYSGILFSFLFGLLFFGDRLTPAAGLGMALIVAAGIACTAFKPKT